MKLPIPTVYVKLVFESRNATFQARLEMVARVEWMVRRADASLTGKKGC